MRPDETATIETGTHRWSEIDQQMMRRALTLAARGAGQVSPSPLVGCVITDASCEVVGEGFYLYENLKHAETLALEEAGPKAKGATAYVSLEPHAHHGRTPPCTDALIRAGVARVVAPIEDPNPKVSGQGFNHLRAAGLVVETGLLAHEAARLNEKYIHCMRHARPFVHLKLACSLDGRIATRTGDSRWITSPKARERVHQLRHEYDAILIGSGTAINDDPLLTDRSGEPRRLPLVRIVLDPRLRLSPASQLALSARDVPLIVFTAEGANASAVEALKERGVEVLDAGNGGRDLENVLNELGRRSIQSVLVEGGASVAGAFLSAGLVDKVSFFIAPLIIGGCDAPPAVGGTGAEKISDAVRLRDVEISQQGPDVEITGYPDKGMKDDVKKKRSSRQSPRSFLIPHPSSLPSPRAKKSLGQNFLTDELVAARIVDALGPRADETIIEIGPGQGALTSRLLERAGRVVAVELDFNLARTLREEFASNSNFHLLEADALDTDFCALITPDKSARLVANLPYNISTAILQRLIRQRACLSELVLMLQREVVERITAPPASAERGYLSVLVEAYCEREALFDVAPQAFRPVPKVWSTVVHLRMRPHLAVEVEDEDLLWRLVSAGFAQRRKTIFNNLRSAPFELTSRLERAGGARPALEAAHIAPDRRAETLNLEEWAALTRTIEQAPARN